MKTAVYIENNTLQLVLTPEDQFESGILASFKDQQTSTEILKGSFYKTQGGWTRNGLQPYEPAWPADGTDLSLILRIEKQENQ